MVFFSGQNLVIKSKTVEILVFQVKIDQTLVFQVTICQFTVEKTHPTRRFIDSTSFPDDVIQGANSKLIEITENGQPIA